MPGYPVAYDQAPSVERNRLTIFFRGIMTIPLMFVAFFYLIGAVCAVVVAWVALLFTGRWPAGLYAFVSGWLRFSGRVMAYYLLLTDVYPPFDGGEHPEYPIQIAIAPPKDHYSRVKVLFRGLFAIPVLIVVYAMELWLFAVAIVMWLSGVFLGRTSLGLLESMRMPMAYYIRAQAFYYLVTEDYPPFNPGPGVATASNVGLA